MFGTSYNKICDKDVSTKSYPEQFVKVWRQVPAPDLATGVDNFDDTWEAVTSCSSVSKSGTYTVDFGDGAKTEVYCDSDKDGGGWHLWISDNGKGDPWALEPGPTLTKAGRLRIPKNMELDMIRIVAKGPSTPVTSIITNDERVVAPLYQAFSGDNPPTGKVLPEYTQIPWSIGDDNTCALNGFRNYNNIHYRPHGHTWILGHQGGSANGWILVGTSYSMICDVNFAANTAFPAASITTWFKLKEVTETPGTKTGPINIQIGCDNNEHTCANGKNWITLQRITGNMRTIKL